MNTMGVLIADAVAAFAVFARHQNFTHAAEELHIAQPSLHAKINKLATSLGQTLYVRDGRRVLLTRDGERLAGFANDQARLAQDYLATHTGQPKRLAIASGRAALQYVIGDAVRDLVRAEIEVSIAPLDRTAALTAVLTGDADVATIAYDPPPVNLACHHLIDVDQVLAMPTDHQLAAKRSVTLADLDDLPLVLPPGGRPHRQVLNRLLGDRCRVAAEADGWDMLLHLASLGLGAAVVNGCVKMPEGLIARPITDLPRVGYWLAWRREREQHVAPLVNRMAIHG